MPNGNDAPFRRALARFLTIASQLPARSILGRLSPGVRRVERVGTIGAETAALRRLGVPVRVGLPLAAAAELGRQRAAEQTEREVLKLLGVRTRRR